jgi:hypothetical protein
MRKHGGGIFTALAAAGLLLATATTPSDAASRKHHTYARTSGYDGLWTVMIHTQAGPCDPTYRYPARIVHGVVVQAQNDFSYQISGGVVSTGAMAVTVSKGGQSATGYGRLHGRSGGGRWSAGGNTCYGTWSAARRG